MTHSRPSACMADEGGLALHRLQVREGALVRLDREALAAVDREAEEHAGAARERERLLEREAALEVGVQVHEREVRPAELEDLDVARASTSGSGPASPAGRGGRGFTRRLR